MAKTRKTKYVILGLLMHGSWTGYDIKKMVEQQLSHFWSESYGQIYPALQEMESEGLVKQVQEEHESRGERKVYSITEAGRNELAKWLRKPVEEEKLRYEVLLKLFFSGTVPVKESIRHIADFKRRQEIKLSEVALFEENLRNALEHGRDHTFYWLTVLCGKKVYQAYIEWCEEALGVLASME